MFYVHEVRNLLWLVIFGTPAVSAGFENFSTVSWGKWRFTSPCQVYPREADTNREVRLSVTACRRTLASPDLAAGRVPVSTGLADPLCELIAA
jgi:hypothetical protein